MRNLKTLALVASTIALSFAAPAIAQSTSTTTSEPAPTTCVGGNLCGGYGTMIGADIAGATFGEGLAGARATGGHTETGAVVEKTGTLVLSAIISGESDGCETACGEFAASLYGEGTENIRAAGFAIATGTNEASAGVANATQGGVSLLGRATFSNMPAPAPQGE